MKKYLHALISGVVMFFLSLAASAQDCDFIPPSPINFNDVCAAQFALACPETTIPECGCMPDPNTPPALYSKKFDLVFSTFSAGEVHLDTTKIIFGDLPSAACSDVTINLSAIGDLSSKHEVLILIDEKGNEICRVGETGPDCSLIASSCTMSFCEFNSQISGGLHWYIRPNSLVASSGSFPGCSENWVNVELSIPQSNIKAVNNLDIPCGENISLPYGKHNITWTSINRYTCEEMQLIQEISVSDDVPPVFVPSCPTGTITLNAGPGECVVTWNAPPFTAMDNCPAGQYFGNINRVGNICRTNAAWQISGGAGAWGVMFDLVNTSGGQLNLQEVGWFSFANVNHNIYYRTAPGPYAPVQATASAWTLCASRVATHAGFSGPKDTFNLITGTAYDTLKRCDPIIVDSTKIGCLTMAAGETRGVYIHAPGQASAYLSIFGDCTTGIFGDANVNTPVNGATYTGGLFTAPFVNSSFGFGNTNWIGHIGYALATSNRVRVIQTCGAPYGPGCYFPIGCTTLCYEARDAAGNLATCTFDVCVNAYANPKRSLSCNDDVQVSLDEECYATVGADDVLEGGPYSCYDDYIVEIRNWNTGQLIDRRPTVPGVQVGVQDIGQNYQVKVIDPVTGNSCWGHIRIEDKLAPVLTCPGDLTLDCTASTLPANTGTPTVEENCGGYTLTYQDNVTQGSCALGYDKIIERRWTAIDGSGNKSSCVQTITVNLGDLNNVLAPANYDGLPGNRAMLACDGKIDRNKDVTPHEVAPDTCIDGYLLDSVYWRANPTRPNIYLGPGGTLGRRIPRALGWNCIDDVNDPNYGHPSPDPVYYPAHKNWDALNPNCYGPEVHVMWYGTGRPATACRNFGTTYQDVIIDLAKPGCDAGPIGCYKVLRQWTVMDWCTGKVGGHNQVIKVADVEGPKVLYPDSAVVTMDVWSCTGTWEVPPAWLLDNCSNELHYTVEVEDGVVSGNETDGYIVSGLPRGIQNAYIVAEDCCGNITKKTVRLNVLDNVPPIPVCIRNTVVSLVGGGSAGENITKIFATSFDEGSFDNCSPHIYVKAIRMEELLGTINGRLPPTDNRVSCNGLNGDDDPDPVFAPGNQVYFDDFVKFCCADVGQKIMVVMRVFDVDPGAGPIHPNRMGRSGPNLQFVGDLFGHYSDCMVEVEVQDKVLPTLIPPPNIVVSCWFWYDFEKLRDPLDPTFGRVVTDLSARAKVKTNDLVCQRYCVPNTLHNYPGPSAGAVPPNLPAANIACNYYNSLYNPAHPDNKYELVWGFDGYVTGGCNVSVTVTPNDDNVKCGQGVLTRTFTVRTSTGVTLSRQQTIWIVDCDPFYVNPADYCDPNDDIEWPTCISASLPGRVELDGCGADLSPDNPRLGRPKVMNNADDNCALIAIEYDDEVFTIEPDACLKVIRTWTVIDWCQYDPSRNILTGRWEYQQVIKVRDNDDPVVDCSMSDCEPATKDPLTGICWGHINLTATATDHCTPEDWLFWEYKIDLYNDGKGSHSGYDLKVGSLTHKQFDNGETPRFNHNPYADNQGNPFNASGVYPIGVHRISWYVEDGCGNIGVCEKLFEIKDCKAPTPYCLSGIVTTVMPSTGCITIWAKDFDHGSYDNCTPPANLKIYFEGGSDSLLICCSDFEAKRVNDELILPVKICVEDEEGNKDCCETTMIVQDPNNVCPDDGTFNGKVYGAIKTNNGSETSDADVELMKNGQLMKEMMTSVDGKYTFSKLIEGQDYVIKPERNDNYLNGVSTADIVKIQKHILGQEEFRDPVQFIAADVNKSKTITASDISEIRKLILGVTSKFTKTPSWWIIPSDYVFSDPTQPFDFPTSKEIKNLQSENKVDFMSIKVGDVNQTARAHFGQNIETRTGAKLRLEVKEQEFKAGESYEIEVSSRGFESITGFQYTISFDASAIEIVSVESGSLTIEEKNFNLGRRSEGIVTMSWDNSGSQTVTQGETLYKLRVQAMKGGKLSRLMSITGDLTSSEAYDKEGNLKEVVLDVRNSDTVVESGVFELYQNNPNPFNKETVISYRLPESGPVKLTLYDLTGKVIRFMNSMDRRA
ncbi:MAG: HYR domain-containing protein [Saprospiraceae bacterium]|nr:HYR domain-containing protein [Saprospiraceae bacterium]